MNKLELQSEALRACRVCLATDCKLVTLGQGGLADTFLKLTGIPVSPTDGFPQHLCSMCAALLRKSAAFREKCRNTHYFLQRVGKQLTPLNKPQDQFTITMPLLRNLDRKYLILPYVTTYTTTMKVPWETDNNANVNNNEVPVKLESPKKAKEDSDEDCVIIEDCGETILKEETREDWLEETIFTDLITYETMLNEETVEESKTGKLPTNSNVTENPISVSKDKEDSTEKETFDIDREKIKEFLINNAERTQRHYKMLFHKYILNKYFHKAKDTENKATADNLIDKCETPATELPTFKVSNGSIIIAPSEQSENVDITDDTEVTTDEFYKYIRDKYKHGALNKTKTTDLNKMRIGKLKLGRSRSKRELQQLAKSYNFDLIFLTKSEQILDLEQARKASYLQSKFKCEQCFRGFKSVSVFQKHAAVHNPSTGSFKCEVCNHYFKSRRQMKDHTDRHKTKLVCRECGHVVRKWSDAKQHQEVHKGVSYNCEHCGAAFRKLKSRLEHVRIHHGAAACGVCYRGFHGSKGLQLHKILAHKQIFECESCAVQFDSARAIIRHMGAAPGGACDPNMRACAKCGELFASDELLGEHVARHHVGFRNMRGRPKGSSKPRTFRKCCTCPHVDQGSNEQNAPTDASCPCVDGATECLCPKGSVRSCRANEPTCFRNVGEGRLKSRRHVGCCGEIWQNKREIMCDMCGTLWSSKAALKIHQTTHTGEKPYKCPECPKRFSTKLILEDHIRTHTGLRPYKCPVCPRSFTSQSNRARHGVVHTQERPFSCGLCSKTFKTVVEVKLHMRAVHMKVPQKPRVRRKRRASERNE